MSEPYDIHRYDEPLSRTPEPGEEIFCVSGLSVGTLNGPGIESKLLLLVTGVSAGETTPRTMSVVFPGEGAVATLLEGLAATQANTPGLT